MFVLQLIEGFPQFILLVTGALVLSIFTGLMWFIITLFVLAETINVITYYGGNVSNMLQSLSYFIMIALSFCLAIISLVFTVKASIQTSSEFTGWVISALIASLFVGIFWGGLTYFIFNLVSNKIVKENLKRYGAMISYTLVNLSLIVGFISTIERAMIYFGARFN